MESRSSAEIEASTEKLLNDLKAVVRDGEELLQVRIEDLSEKGLQARERLMAALEVARETRLKLQQQASAGVAATDRVIRGHPYESVGIAFAAGLLLGILLNSK